MKSNDDMQESGMMVMFAVVLVIAASAVLLYGLCQHPVGEIAYWALWIFGNALSAAAAILGMDRHYRSKYGA